MLEVYPAIFHEEDGFWVEFPDLPGCNAYGKTLDEAKGQAQEALDIYLTTLVESGLDIPAPSQSECSKKIAIKVEKSHFVDVNKMVLFGNSEQLSK